MKNKLGKLFIAIMVISVVILLLNIYMFDNDIIFTISFTTLILSIIGVFKYTKNPMEIICNLIDMS